MDMHPRMSSLPARSNAPHSSRRLSSNSSLSSLSELGVLAQQQQQQHYQQQDRRISSSSSSSSSSSTGRKDISSSPSSSTNMMKKLGSRFALKRKDAAAAATAPHEDAIEELVYNDEDEDENVILSTVRPRAGRTLTSSNTSSTSARPPSLYGDSSNSGNTINRLKHRSSLSNLNASNGSIASISNSSANSSIQRQSHTLRHRASISSLSGSENGTKSPPGTALRQPGTLRHRSSISSLSSVAMSKPTGVRESTSTQAAGSSSLLRTVSTTGISSTTMRPTPFAAFPPSTNTNDKHGSTSAIASGVGSLSNARRLSATHTGLSPLRTRTTSLISPPKASSGMSSRQGSSNNSHNTSSTSTTVIGDTSIVRRGIPKSSTTSIARIASTSSSSNSASNSSSVSHKRIHSIAIANTTLQYDSTPKASSSSSSKLGMKKITPNRDTNIEDSPGLEELVNNTTLQMADLKDMLSPIAISRVTLNSSDSKMNYTGIKTSSSSNKQDLNRESSSTTATRHKISSSSYETLPNQDNVNNAGNSVPKVNNNKEESEESTFNNSPSKSGLPLLLNRNSNDPTRKATPKSSSPSPTKLRIKSASPQKGSRGPSSLITGMPSTGGPLTQDGLPALPGARKYASPITAPLRPPFPTSKTSRHLSPSPAPLIPPSSPSSIPSRSTATPLVKRNIKESKDLDVDEMEKLLSEEGFLSPAKSLITADSSTLIMHHDLSNVMMTALKFNEDKGQSRLGHKKMENVMVSDKDYRVEDEKQRKLEIEQLLQEEREKIRQEMTILAKEELLKYELKVNEDRKQLDSLLSRKEEEILKQSKELVKLQKLLAYNATNTLKTIQFENQIYKQDNYDMIIKRLQYDLKIAHDTLKTKEMENILYKTKNNWKTFEKEIEIEKDIIVGQLEMMDHLKGLVGHISLCVQKNMTMTTVMEL